MSIISEYIDVEIVHQNVKKYKNKGYDCKVGDIISVYYKDVLASKKYYLKCLCEYCGEDFEITTDAYHKIQKGIIKKLCCGKNTCQNKKMTEVMMIKYNVTNSQYLQSVQDKKKSTCLKKYGVDNPMKVQEFQDKAKETNIEKYGVDNPMKNDEIKQKFTESMLKTYGVEHIMSLKDYQDKRDETMLKRYGATFKRRENTPVLFEIPEIKERKEQTLFEKYGVTSSLLVNNNESRHISKNEKYICNLLNAEPQIQIGYYIGDMLICDNIIIEYDGSGHNIKEKYMTHDEYINKERYREDYIISKGYKIIRLIAKHDILPQDKIILDIIENAKNYLKYNNIYKFDLELMKQIQ